MNQKKAIPYYAKKKGTWRIKFKEEYKGKKYKRTEEGELTYVVCEYLNDSLYYPFWLDDNRDDLPLQPHDHSFNDVLSWLLHYPNHFSIEGFEEYYSKQEIELLQKFQKKLLEDKGRSKED